MRYAQCGELIGCPYAVHEECLSGVLRDWLNRLTRKMHAFAKQEQTWDAAVVLCLFETNWLRAHLVLREFADGLTDGRGYRHKALAMAIGLTEHVRSWEEFLPHRHYHLKE